MLLAAVVLALSACDRDFTATVSPDQTVSGQVTYTFVESGSEGAPVGDMVENQLLAAFPSGTLTEGETSGRQFRTMTFTGVTFDQFEHGLVTVLSDPFPGTEETADAPTASLTFADGRYRLEAANVAGVVPSEPGGAEPVLNRLALTFPAPVVETNGAASGNAVVWDFLAHPELTSLLAVTKSPAPVAQQPQPLPYVQVAAGKVVKRGVPVVGRRVSVRAPRALTAGAARRYVWIVGGKPVATTSKPSYVLKRKQAGKRLTVQVEYVKAGYQTTVRQARFGKVRR